jgi:hypothetical protein
MADVAKWSSASVPLCGKEKSPPATRVSKSAQIAVAISPAAAKQTYAAAGRGHGATRRAGIATRNPDSACQPFMSLPRTWTECAESPTPKSGLTIIPGMLQARIVSAPTTAAHWTGENGHRVSKVARGI